MLLYDGGTTLLFIVTSTTTEDKFQLWIQSDTALGPPSFKEKVTVYYLVGTDASGSIDRMVVPCLLTNISCSSR